ncbi:MAG: sensor histidine kinase [Saprospiraceae bacterium]
MIPNSRSYKLTTFAPYLSHMDTTAKKNVKTQLVELFTTRVVYHSLFWLALFLLLVLLDTTSQNFLFVFIVELITLAFYALVVYFNLLYLIPNYLSEKKFFLYGSLLVLTVLITTPIKMLVLYFAFTYLPELQAQLLIDQKWFFLTTFVIAGGSTVVKIISDWVRYQRDRKELQTQTMQSELKFLKSQINPHFLFNTLNNLYALTLKKSDKAPEIVIKLSEMMRYMLYDCNERRVMLSKEVNYIQNYLDLERLRQSADARITFKVEGRASDQKIAPLLFIPFLENSFKHGLNSSISKGFVDITLKIEDKHIDFHMVNSKADTLPMQTHKRSGGIGLKNVRRRLQLQYPDRYALNVEDSPNAYAVRLELELEEV